MNKLTNLYKKALAGTLAVAVIASGMGFGGINAKEVKAADLNKGLVADFGFNDSLENAKAADKPAVAKSFQLGEYKGEVKYVEGRYADAGKAVKLDGYGIDPLVSGVGKEFSVSVWMKPDGTFAENQVLIFLGSDAPEQWAAVNGNRTNTNEVKFWAKGGEYSWTTLATPTIDTKNWHNIVITGNTADFKIYVDGTVMAQRKTNDPLGIENGVVYIGVNKWDKLFSGAVDDLKVYNIELSAEDIRADYVDNVKKMLMPAFEAAVKDASVIGKNASVNEIKYDLVLPDKVFGNDIKWVSSDAEVINNEGVVVKAPAEDKEITLTGTVNIDGEKMSQTLTVKALKLDETKLTTLITAAKGIDKAKLSAADAARVTSVIEEAEAADTHKKYDAVLPRLDRIVNDFAEKKVNDVVENPFVFIEEPVAAAEVKAGEAKTVFAVPENIKDSVNVEYSSNDVSVVKYENGIITGVKDGKAIVTAKVTAKSDDFAMEYSVAVTVAGKAVEPTEIPTVVPTTTPTAAPYTVSRVLSVSANAAGDKVKPVKISAIVSDSVSLNIAGVTDYSKLKVKGGTLNGNMLVLEKKGSVKVMAPNSKGKYKAILVIKAEQPKIKKKLKFKTGKTKKLKVSGTKVSVDAWTTSDEKIVTVDASGVLTGKASGNATVTAWINGHSYSCEVTVK